MPLTSERAAELIISHTPSACEALNSFTAEVFRTRGGRIGSGMGAVIEGLWGFYLNKTLKQAGVTQIELAWIYGHEYNDFACVDSSMPWHPETQSGEVLRVEVKSMVAAADESKAHFDRLVREMNASELLAVFLWNWTALPGTTDRVYPKVVDHFVGRAVEIAKLRDALHILRGGTFVAHGKCPDRCAPKTCAHVGEPLNARGVRERRTGPEQARGGKASYAANFGGLLRMLGFRGSDGEAIIRDHCTRSRDAAEFINFMGRNFSRTYNPSRDP